MQRLILEHLPHIPVSRQQIEIVFQNEIQPASPELLDLFARQIIGANDTSAAVGDAPLTETECCVLATERRLNSPAFKAQFPEAGEDVKVMGCRQWRHLTLTIALAFVDHFLPDALRETPLWQECLCLARSNPALPGGTG